jgi:hypothetical protein
MTSGADEAAKQVWNDRASEDKERHSSEMKDYVPPDDAETPSKKQKKKKDPNAPKNPTTYSCNPSILSISFFSYQPMKLHRSYFFFAAQQRALIKAENPSETIGEIGRITGAKWKAIGINYLILMGIFETSILSI